MHILKKIITFLIIILFFTISIFLLVNSRYIQIDSPFNGYGLRLENLNGEAHNSFTIDVNNKTEFNYNVKFLNDSGVDGTFILLLFLDYIQIPFYFEGEQNIVDHYVFDAKNNEEINLPIRFLIEDLNPNSMDLFVSVLAGPNMHANSLDLSTDFYGVNARYTLQFSENQIYASPVDIETPKNILTIDTFSGILLNQDAEPKEATYLPPVQINAKSKEKITFTLRAGGHSHTTDYIALIIVDWKQTTFGNNQSFWYFNVPEGNLGYKQIELIAPELSGEYEVCAYLVPNPWKSLDESRYIGIDTSYRFTLLVE